MITSFDAAGVIRQYDFDQVAKVRKPEPLHAYEEDEQEPGSRRPVTAEALRAGRGYNPWREANDRNDQQGEREQVRIAEQIMSYRVETLTAETSIADAWDVFMAHGYRHMPVVHDETGALIGILSERDMLRAAGTPDHTPGQSIRDEPISSIMTSPVYSARPSTNIRDIAKVLFAERIGAMVITDEHQKLLGILTRSDILRGLVNTAPLHLWV
jgi:acetoin utilization protein AcuB